MQYQPSNPQLSLPSPSIPFPSCNTLLDILRTVWLIMPCMHHPVLAVLCCTVLYSAARRPLWGREGGTRSSSLNASRRIASRLASLLAMILSPSSCLQMLPLYSISWLEHAKLSGDFPSFFESPKPPDHQRVRAMAHSCLCSPFTVRDHARIF